MPEEIPSVITPRSKERADVAGREWEEAERELLDPRTKQWRKSRLVWLCRRSESGILDLYWKTGAS
jgi:hypothetical protein